MGTNLFLAEEVGFTAASLPCDVGHPRFRSGTGLLHSPENMRSAHFLYGSCPYGFESLYY